MTPEQRIYAVMFNSIGPALKTAGLWAPLFARQRIAESISEALAAHSMTVADVCACGQPVGVCPCGDPRCWRCDPWTEPLPVPCGVCLVCAGRIVGGDGECYAASQECAHKPAPQPPGTLQDAIPARGGMSGCPDDPQGTASLSGLPEELDRLRTEAERMRGAYNAANAMRGVHELRATRLKTELDHAKAVLAGDNEAIGLFMADCGKTAERLREQVSLWQKAAEEAEAAIDRVHAEAEEMRKAPPHHVTFHNGCVVRAAIDADYARSQYDQYDVKARWAYEAKADSQKDVTP